MMGCTKCGLAVHQQMEKAIGEPRETAWAIVWADDSGEWTCKVDGNEHDAKPDLIPFEVEFTVVAHVLAYDEDKAFAVAEPHAQRAAADGAWNTYDECVTEITEEQF